MRLIDADALKAELEPYRYAICGFEGVLYLIDNAPTIEPRIEYGSDGQPYRLFISGGHVVPDVLQGWKYQENTPTVTSDMAQVLAYESGKASADRQANG